MLHFDDVSNDAQNICEDLVKLASTPGPTGAVARVSKNDPRAEGEYSMTKVVREIITKRIAPETNISIHEDHGNLVLVAGLEKETPTRSDVQRIPVTLASHLDEITYLICNNERTDGVWRLMPLCNAPKRVVPSTRQLFMHKEAMILGYRSTLKSSKENSCLREFRTIGYGEFSSSIERVEGEVRRKYWVKVERLFGNEKIRPGDVVIQNYGTVGHKMAYNTESKIGIKALDDRVGVTAHLYTLKYLAERGIPAKLILSGDEEGYPEDVSWARLIRHTFKKYCDHDNIIIICDGADGSQLKGLPENKNDQWLSEALLVPYTSHGKGGGEHGIFSLLRDDVSDVAKRSGFSPMIDTDYVSRSLDPKIMDEFSFITFIDWSNGQVGNELAICHLDESVLVKQLINVIGVTWHATKYFYDKIKK